MPENILRQYWGYNSFRPKQKEIITEALCGRDVLAILPTGGGKSVCFQVPTLMKPGVSVVVTPLIALMKDQVSNLNDRGIKSLAIYSGMTSSEIQTALDNAVYGDFKFLYLSPERLKTDVFLSRLPYMNIAFLVIDEAHCISQWGYDFRPDYLEISHVREIIPDVPVIALTATATPEVAGDIMKRLSFPFPNMIKSGFERENLSYVVRKTEDKLGQILSICKGVPGTGIVYVRTRKKTAEIASFLTANGYSADAYHAGMGRDVREAKQQDWKSGKTRIIVSTNAFGMGIDKPDVRFVCHYDVPDSIEAYFQEAGRGGRDGLRSYAVLLWNDSDIRRLRQIRDASFPPLDYIEGIYQKVHEFLGIGYDQGEGMMVPFNIGEFCKRYKLSITSCHYAMKYIESENHWEMEEDAELPARVTFIVDREALYSYQPANASEEAVLDMLMRRYPCIMHKIVPVDTEFIAALTDLDESSVKQQLYWLSVKGIIKYIPSDRQPMLRLLENRLMRKNVALPKSRYDERLSRFTTRMEAMISYVTGTDKCRSVSLLEYFGDDAGHPCGKCDVCIGKNRNSARAMEGRVDGYVRKYDFSKIFSMYGIKPTAPDSISRAVCTNEFLRDFMAYFGDEYVKATDVLRSLLDSDRFRIS